VTISGSYLFIFFSHLNYLQLSEGHYVRAGVLGQTITQEASEILAKILEQKIVIQYAEL
jgi:hypothetical protein